MHASKEFTCLHAKKVVLETFFFGDTQYVHHKYRVNSGSNIARALVLSNSVYVSVLKISIVLADCVSKQIRQDFFFLRELQLLAREKILYFATIIDTN